jgi:hypothetical protein
MSSVGVAKSVPPPTPPSTSQSSRHSIQQHTMLHAAAFVFLSTFLVVTVQALAAVFIKIHVLWNAVHRRLVKLPTFRKSVVPPSGASSPCRQSITSQKTFYLLIFSSLRVSMYYRLFKHILLLTWILTWIKYSSVSQTFFRERTIIHIPKKNPANKNWKKNYKETVVSARRLLRNFQLPNRNSRDISRYIYNPFAAFQNSNVFIPVFLPEPLTMFCGTL